MRLSSLQGLHVCDEAGQRLGRVFDFRCRGAPVDRRVRDDAEVTTLVYGTVGMFERLGLREARTCEARWQDVVAIRDGRIVVRARNGRQRGG